MKERGIAPGLIATEGQPAHGSRLDVPGSGVPVGTARPIGLSIAWYTIAVLASRFVSVLTLPVYTRYLAPHQYGIMQMLGMTSDMAAILLTAGMSSGVQRFYFKATSDRERSEVVVTALTLEVGLAVIGTILMLGLSQTIWLYFLGGVGSVWFVRIVAVDFTFGVLSAVPFLYLQSHQRSRAVATITLARMALQTSLNLVLLVGFDLGVAAILTSTLITNVVFGLSLAIWLLRQTGWRFSWSMFQTLRRFGVPNQVTFAGSFILTFSDRLFLEASDGLASVGLYSFAYQFGFMLAQVSATPFLQAWTPERFRSTSLPRHERDAESARTFLLFNVLLLGSAVGLSVFIQPVLSVLTTSLFQEAAMIVPIIIFAYVVRSWTDVIKFGIDVAEQTRFHAYATWLSVAATLVLFSVLIPRYGEFGAAGATVLSSLVTLGLSYRWSQRLWPIDYEWNRVLMMTACAIVAVAAYYLVGASGFFARVGFASLSLTLFVGLTFGLVFRREERAIIRSAIAAPRQALALFGIKRAS